MTMKKWLISVGLLLALNPVMSFAIAPVEDYSQQASDSQEGGISLSKPARHDAESLSLPDRLQRVESKVDNLTQANVTSRVEELQQTIQELRGELEKQSHELEQLAANQKSFYQDINNRLSQAKETAQAVVSNAAADNPPVSSPVKASAAIAKSTAAPVTNTPIADDVAPQAKPSSNVVAAKANPSAASSAEAQSGEQGLYQQGFALLKSKQYDRALTQFKDYVSKYPQGRWAVNAHFWMGEINYLQGKHSAAKKSFEIVVKDYPKDQKIPDALLKLAIIATDTGHKQKAEEMLVQIQKRYPGTTAARLAMIRVQELRLSTH